MLWLFLSLLIIFGFILLGRLVLIYNNIFPGHKKSFLQIFPINLYDPQRLTQEKPRCVLSLMSTFFIWRQIISIILGLNHRDLDLKTTIGFFLMKGSLRPLVQRNESATLPWNQIFNKVKAIFKNNQLREFYFKLIHHIVAMKKELTLYGILYNNTSYSRICLVLAYDLLEDRRTIDVSLQSFSLCVLKWRKVLRI